MTVFHLVRHGAHDLLGRTLVGRGAGVSLNAEGRRQADGLAARLAAKSPAAVMSSPRERARETAAPIARGARLNVLVTPELDEFDMGEWTGRSFVELDVDPLWRRFNRLRSITRPPGGELMIEVQSRVVALIERLHRTHADGHVVLVSHGDVIRAALLHCLAMPLDAVHRLEVGPGSSTTVLLREGEPIVLGLNEIAEGAG
jgi:probable phosphoglycerate mutase